MEKILSTYTFIPCRDDSGYAGSDSGCDSCIHGFRCARRKGHVYNGFRWGCGRGCHWDHGEKMRATSHTKECSTNPN